MEGVASFCTGHSLLVVNRDRPPPTKGGGKGQTPCPYRELLGKEVASRVRLYIAMTEAFSFFTLQCKLFLAQSVSTA